VQVARQPGRVHIGQPPAEQVPADAAAVGPRMHRPAPPADRGDGYRGADGGRLCRHPQRARVESLWTLLFHLTPLVTATVAIGWLHLPWAYRLRLHLILPRRSTVLRLAGAMLLLQLSGVEDLAFLIIRDLNTAESHPIPAVWDWADHMAARLGGHYPTREQAYVFIGAHLVAAVAVLFVPGRVVGALARRWRGARRDDRPAAR
jgi:hypothetical protein